MRHRYPALEETESGMLGVGDGQRIWWSVAGNPAGTPAVILHGGPGSGSHPGSRRDFDPARYRIVQFDQRGCGQSTPNAGESTTDLATNTTHHLIADIERLRTHLGIERWVVWGASWGVTLGLAYAERHPERVIAMVLASITMTRPVDVRWLAHGAGRFFPADWDRFRAFVPAAERDDLVAAYDRLLNHQPDDELREQAAEHWVAWEDALLSLDEGYEIPNPRWADRRYRMAFARLVTHYFAHAAWLEDDDLLRNAGRLAGIPGVLVHGRLDIEGPADVAWLLAQAWPDADLHFVTAGHRGNDEATNIMVAATDRFADLR